jgi:hypothetical protein
MYCGVDRGAEQIAHVRNNWLMLMRPPVATLITSPLASAVHARSTPSTTLAT